MPTATRRRPRLEQLGDLLRGGGRGRRARCCGRRSTPATRVLLSRPARAAAAGPSPLTRSSAMASSRWRRGRRAASSSAPYGAATKSGGRSAAAARALVGARRRRPGAPRPGVSMVRHEGGLVELDPAAPAAASVCSSCGVDGQQVVEAGERAEAGRGVVGGLAQQQERDRADDDGRVTTPSARASANSRTMRSRGRARKWSPGRSPARGSGSWCRTTWSSRAVLVAVAAGEGEVAGEVELAVARRARFAEAGRHGADGRRRRRAPGRSRRRCRGPRRLRSRPRLGEALARCRAGSPGGGRLRARRRRSCRPRRPRRPS